MPKIARICLLALGTIWPLSLSSQNAPTLKVTTVRPPDTIRIELIGDSTQTDNAGYGRGFCANFTAKIDCLNFAHGGTSTKTFRRDGHWERALASKPNYMLIQFGHNDEVSKEPNDRQVPIDGYQENLRAFIREARAQKIIPVLVTPLTRRNWGKDGKIHSDLTAYAEAMTAVAKEMKTPLIDLQLQSIAYLDGIGQVKGTALGITKKDKYGKVALDGTHLNWLGSYIFGRMVAEDLGKAVPEIAAYVTPKPASLPGEGEVAMKVIHGGRFKIVLVGDSTVATKSGWGPGFCATLTPNVTCIDDGQGGRSTKSYLDEGQWKKALAEKGQFYFIQFGHNDQKTDPKLFADAKGAYKDNLHLMIREARQAGAIPILLSPLSRRNYHDGKLSTDDGLRDYATAAREVASEDRVTFVDLYQMSQQYLRGLTQDQADALDMAAEPNAKGPDRTHLNAKGSALFGRLVADNVTRSEVELGPNINGLPEGSMPATLPMQAAPTDGH